MKQMKCIKIVLPLFLALTLLSIKGYTQTKNIDSNGLSNQLIGYFSFNDTGSSVLCDWGEGIGKTGLLVGETSISSTDVKYSGNALSINGNIGDAYVTFDAENSLPFVMKGASEVTIALWIKPSQFGEQFIVSTMDIYGGETNRLEISSEDLLKATSFTRNKVGAFEFSSIDAKSANHKLGEELILDTWIHVAYVYNSSETTAKIYINGVLSKENNKLAYDLVTFDRQLNLGAYYASNKTPSVQKQYDGLIDELYFFNRALSISEINTLKDLQNPLDEAVTYTATFDYDYESLTEDKLAIVGNDHIVEVPILEREGYTFDGWYTLQDGLGIKLTGEDVQLSSDMTYYAHWVINIYTITLHKNGEIENVTFTISDLPKLIADDVKDSETFYGWFKDEDLNERLPNNNILTLGDITLWAGFSTNATVYLVTLSDRSNVYGERVAVQENSYQIEVPDLSVREDNYRFAGWYTEEDGQGEYITNYSIISNDITLYAYWTPMLTAEDNTLDIDNLSENLIGYFSFDSHIDGDVVCTDGEAKNTVGNFVGDGASLNSSQTKFSESALEIDNAFVSFDVDNSAPFRMAGASAITVLCWVKPQQLGEQHILSLTSDTGGNSYSLEINSNNYFKTFISTYDIDSSPQFSNGNSQSIDHTLGEEVNLNEWVHVAFVYNSIESRTSIYVNGVLSNEDFKTDYGLVEFDTYKLNFGAEVALDNLPSIDKNYKGLIDEVYFFERALSITEINTLKNTEKPVELLTEYIAVFNDNIGLNADTLRTTILDNNKVDPSLIVPPTREGYTFSGWYSTPDGTGDVLMTDELLELPSDQLFYAKWELTPYVITYNMGDNSVETETFYLTDLPKELEDDSKDAHYFSGWFKDESYLELLNDKLITEVGDIEVWADFTSNNTFYTINLSDADSTVGVRVAKEENNYQVILPNLPNREDDYRHNGWFTATNGGGENITSYSQIEEEATLYAYWVPMLSDTDKMIDIDNLSDNLIGYFSFNSAVDADVICDEGSSQNTFGDFSNNDAFLNTENPKYSGSSLEIENASVRFNQENSAEFRMEGASAVSVACWIKPYQLGDQSIISLTNDDGGGSYRLELTSENLFKAYLSTYDEDTESFSYGNALTINHQMTDELQVNEWIHLAFVYNSEESKTSIYVNGVLSGSEVITGYKIVTFDNYKLNIGAEVAINNDPVTQKHFNGLIDELYFYDRVLSLQEINTIKDLENPTQFLQEYIAVFNDNIGLSKDTLKVTSLANYTIDPSIISEPEREGYDFKGWYTNIEGTGEKLNVDENVILSQDQLYFAKWELAPYTITYHRANDIIDTELFYITDLPKLLGTDSKTDENFIGWYHQEDSVEVLVASTITELKDIELYAGFTTDSEYYTITLSDRGEVYGARIATLENDYQVSLPHLSTREDTYRFSGWFTEENGLGDRVTDFSTLNSSGRINAYHSTEVVLYAYWNEMVSDELVTLDIDNLSESLIGYFSFDESVDGDVVCDNGVGVDKKGDFNLGATLNTSDPKYSGSALELSDAFVGFDLDNSLPFRMEGASAITIGCWVQPHKTGEQYILATTSDDGGETIRLDITDDNTFRVNIATENGETATVKSTNHKLTEEVNVNDWIHVAVVYEDEEDKTIIYINGEYSNEFSRVTDKVNTLDNKKLNIGAYYALNDADQVQNEFEGLIDELYFFDRALSSEEIITLKDLNNPMESIQEYIAVFNHEDGITDSDTLRTTIIDNFDIDLSIVPDPTRVDHTFKGWYTGKNGTGSELDPVLINTLSDDIIFYAFWELGDASGDLPVELIDFRGEIIDNDIILTWMTATEINNEKFIIQRSSDLRTWKDIAEVKGNGNSSTLISYEYKDTEIITGYNYYRLKQVDFDLSFNYSNIIIVSNTQGNNVSIITYPNPFSDKIIISSTENLNLNKLFIHTLMGQKVEIEFTFVSDKSLILNTSEWLYGMYIISYKNKHKRVMKR